MSYQVKNGTLRFVCTPEKPAQKIFIAGNFNNWELLAMSRRNGNFVRNLKVPTGRYEYKFIIDGIWMHDPDHGDCVRNQLGSLNSIAVMA